MINSTRIFTVLLILFFAVNVFSQKILVNGKESNGVLKWDDYTGKVDEKSEYVSWTGYNYFIEDIKFKPVSNTHVLIEDIKTKLELDSKSWVVDEHKSKYLLKNAQSIFNFGILTIKELRKTLVNKKILKENYQQEIQKIVRDIGDKFNQKSKTFQEETKDYRNKTAREKWEKYFMEELPEIYN